MGAGDYLMSFLGIVILSFGFRIYGQRRLMARHAPEIFGSTTISAAFSLFATAAFAKLLGLTPGMLLWGDVATGPVKFQCRQSIVLAFK